jgi:CBS domain-containing protein
MKLNEIMTPEVVTIGPNASLQQAAQMMASLDIGLLPVIANDELLGVITDRDITIRAAARGLDPKRTQVRYVMTEAVICSSDIQEIAQGAKQMMNHQIRRLPILDGHQSSGDRLSQAPGEALAHKCCLRCAHFETNVPVSYAERFEAQRRGGT